MPAASREEITAFLLQAKKAVFARKFSFEDREKNLRALTAHGLTIDDVSTAIVSLTPRNYSSGPEPDHNPRYPGKVWTFGHNIGGVVFYIKLKLTLEGGVLCLSFHEPEYQMEFPYGRSE